MSVIYVLAIGGLFFAPRAFVALALLLLAYQSLCAAVFVGATRYRVAWDFLVVLLATATLKRAAEWLRERRTVVRVAHVHRIRGIGGSERHLLTLLPALAERGVEPVLVGLDDPAWDPADFYGALRVPAIRIPSPRDVDPLLLARLIRSLRADVVHTHLVHADVYGGVAAKLRGERLVSTKHNDDPFRLGPFRHVERGVTRFADRVVTITDALHRFTVEKVGIPEAKVETIHYGLDDLPEPWGENPADAVPDGARVLLAVSRLTKQKGIDVAVRALESLPDDTVLVVLGEGPERDALESLARDARRRRPRVPAGARARRRRLAPARDAARPSRALGGVRPRRPRGDARRSARRRVERELAAGAGRRRRDRLPRAARRPGRTRAWRRTRARATVARRRGPSAGAL